MNQTVPKLSLNEINSKIKEMNKPYNEVKVNKEKTLNMNATVANASLDHSELSTLLK